MKDGASLTQPLTEEEIEQLDDFLVSDSTPEEAMDVSMMDGFISALSSGPNVMLPSSMLRWIWDAERGEELPTFANVAESTNIVRLIIRYWNAVNGTLNTAPDEYEPLILQRESDGRVVPIIDEWCAGYYKGIAVDLAGWAPLMMQHPEWFTPIILYGTADRSSRPPRGVKSFPVRPTPWKPTAPHRKGSLQKTEFKARWKFNLLDKHTN